VGELEAGSLVVWLVEVEPTRADALASLSGVERERLSAYRRQEDRDRFVAGAMLARSVAARQLRIPPASVELDRTCPQCGRPHGKPHLSPAQYAAAGGLELSISHADRLVGLAATLGHPVGLDVEPVVVQGDPAEIARVALAPDELSAYAAVPADLGAAALMRYWTRKEAVLKALGTGLRIEPSSLVVTPPDQPPAVVSGPGAGAGELEPMHVQLHDLAAPEGYLGSVAVLGAPPLQLRLVRLWGAHRAPWA
jgi:4'-phosphopantetheinyl transferase